MDTLVDFLEPKVFYFSCSGQPAFPKLGGKSVLGSLWGLISPLPACHGAVSSFAGLTGGWLGKASRFA